MLEISAYVSETNHISEQESQGPCHYSRPSTSTPSSTSIDIDQALPLENSWSFWFDRYVGPGKMVEEYAAALVNLGSFSTVQDFWRWYNNLPSAMQLQAGSSFHLMKHGTKPLWEDDENAQGGTFSVRVPKNQTAKAWLYILMAVVGEQFDPILDHNKGDAICGASLSIRKTGDNVLSLWNRNAKSFNFSVFYERMAFLISQCELKAPSYKAHQEESDFKCRSNEQACRSDANSK